MARYGDSKYSIIDVRRSLTRLCTGPAVLEGATTQAPSIKVRLKHHAFQPNKRLTCSDDFEATTLRQVVTSYYSK